MVDVRGEALPATSSIAVPTARLVQIWASNLARSCERVATATDTTAGLQVIAYPRAATLCARFLMRLADSMTCGRTDDPAPSGQFRSECGCCSGELGKGWVGMRCDDASPDVDDEPEIAVYCPPCAAGDSVTARRSPRITCAPGTRCRPKRLANRRPGACRPPGGQGRA